MRALAQWVRMAAGSCGAMARGSRRPGPERRSVNPPLSDGTSTISVVLFSGDRLSPAANRRDRDWPPRGSAQMGHRAHRQSVRRCESAGCCARYRCPHGDPATARSPDRPASAAPPLLPGRSPQPCASGETITPGSLIALKCGGRRAGRRQPDG